jgi:hypothetical protein
VVQHPSLEMQGEANNLEWTAGEGGGLVCC